MVAKKHPYPPSPRAQFALAMQYMQSGNPMGAQVILEQIVAAKPRDFEALHFLGVSYAMGGNLDQAAQLIRKAISIKPDYAEAILNLGNILQQHKMYEDAIACFRKAIALQPQFPDPYFNLCLLLENLNRLEEALTTYDTVISLKPDFAPAYTNRGVVQAKLNRLADALASHDAAIAREPGLADAHANRGDVLRALHRPPEALISYETAIALRPDIAYSYRRRGNVLEELGRYEDALAAYDKSAALEPDFAETHFNRGNVLDKQRRFADALAGYERAIALQPDFPEAHNARGIVLEKLDRYEDAIASYDKVIELRPDFAEAFYNRGNALYELNRTSETLGSYHQALALRPDFAPAKNNVFWYHVRESNDYPLIERLGMEAFELIMKQDFDNAWARNNISDFRVTHDLEQVDYLLRLGHELEGLREAQLRLKEIYATHLDHKPSPDGIKVIPLSEAQAAGVNLFRNSLFRYQIPTPIEHCLNPQKDWQAIEEQYFSSYPEMIYIDNLLSQQALEEMRKFCLISTVWKREYINQYLGAFANMGFISWLHLQIARELQQKIPRIFGDHKLEQVWAYKYNSRLKKGINVHADAAKVNLNFWVTPDEANLNPESGGLIVYDIPPPPSWSFEQYNADEKCIYDFLQKNQSGSLKVPYRCNRAVLFNSALFHETDEIHFREGYENRRINITYLFGKGLKTH